MRALCSIIVRCAEKHGNKSVSFWSGCSFNGAGTESVSDGIPDREDVCAINAASEIASIVKIGAASIMQPNDACLGAKFYGDALGKCI